MVYSPVQSSRLYEQIVEQVEARILSGELEQGARLPAERELAEQLGVSRTAVREATKALREKGLVEVHPGRGTFVSGATSSAVRSSLGRILRFRKGQSADDLVAVRELLEPEIAAMAAERADADQLAVMRKAVEAMDASLDAAEPFIEADLQFHLALAEGTGNSLIPLLIDPIVDLLREQRTQIFYIPGGAARGQMHHKRILRAVSRRDSKAARAAMRDHLKQVRQDSQTAESRT